MSLRFSSRRGSLSASDPHGLHAELNRDRSSSSTLSIVRVSPDQQPPQHRRSKLIQSPRLSFASSSFSSPPRPHRSASISKQHLPPDQLIDLARHSTAPRFQSNSPAISPVSFTPLPPSIFLPFIDRPSEVSALISTPPSAKLFSLLAQTFPPTTAPSPATDDFPPDPASWSYSHLSSWLTQVDRNAAPDALWVFHARKCILSRSELIWERVKGALGIPPELDVDSLPLIDDDHTQDDVFESESDGSGIGIQGRRSSVGTGAWFGLDALQHSPIADHPTSTSRASSPLPLDPPDPNYLAAPQLTVAHLFTLPTSAPQQTPANGAQEAGLQGISEAAEDDDPDPDTAPTKPNDDQDDDAQPQIHGLRFSTAPLPFTPLRSPTSSPPPYPLMDSALSSRSGSFSSLASPGPRRSSFRRSTSFGSLMMSAPTLPGRPVPSSFGAAPGYEARRGNGGPLFPSTFARMATGGVSSMPASTILEAPGEVPHALAGVANDPEARGDVSVSQDDRREGESVRT